MKATIGGKVWNIRFTNRLPADRDGDCTFPHPHGRKRGIRVRRDLAPDRELEVLIHEVLHAALWVIDEAVIEQTALELQRILTERGYQR